MKQDPFKRDRDPKMTVMAAVTLQEALQAVIGPERRTWKIATR